MEPTKTPSRPKQLNPPGLAAALATVRGNLATFGSHFPDDTTVNGVYRLRPADGVVPEGGNRGWTTGFWTGMLWLAWESTRDEQFRRAANAHIDSFAERIRRRIDVEHHDLGFLYTLACVAPWRLLGNQAARTAAIAAAEHLMTRFVEPSGVVQAWGDLADPQQGSLTIIDSLMNMPLLYWASQQTGDPRFAKAARRHTAQLRDHIVRPDGSTYHAYRWDPQTGDPIKGMTAQGHGDNSCWARGQAWGIYGFALGYRYSRDDSFLVVGQACADYFLDHLPADRVAYWDLDFSDGDDQPRDSSAAAIAACGLLELAYWLPAAELRQRYLAEAAAIVSSLAADYAPADRTTSNALILHGVYSKPDGRGIDEGCLWGDYFYLEALGRTARPEWIRYW